MQEEEEMVVLTRKEYNDINCNMKNICDNFIHPKATYEFRARSLVEVYDQKNVFNNLRIVLHAIRTGSDGSITFPRDNKFSLDSYLVYLHTLSNLFKREQYQPVVGEITHVKANNYSVRCVINHQIVDMQKGIKMGANFTNVRLQRVRGEQYDQLFYGSGDDKILLADRIYQLSNKEALDRFNEAIHEIRLPHKLSDAYIEGDTFMIPTIGIMSRIAVS